MLDAIVIGLIESAPLVLAAMGFTLIYYLNGFINVAYAETITVGAYIAVVFNTTLGWDIYAAMIPAAVLAGVFSVVSYLLIFRPALERGVGPVEMIVLAVGLSFFVRYALRIIFGADSKQYELSEPSYLSFFGTGITSTQIISLALVAVSALLCYVLIYRTPYGGQIRAYASNTSLARVSGINPSAVAVLVWFVAGAVGGLAGVFTGTFAFVDHEVGWDMILVLIMISIIGGVGSVRGALAAGLAVAVVTSVVSLWTGSPIYAQVAVLALFIVLLRARASRGSLRLVRS